jgi:hypothetical protein
MVYYNTLDPLDLLTRVFVLAIAGHHALLFACVHPTRSNLAEYGTIETLRSR